MYILLIQSNCPSYIRVVAFLAVHNAIPCSYVINTETMAYRCAKIPLYKQLIQSTTKASLSLSFCVLCVEGEGEGAD